MAKARARPRIVIQEDKETINLQNESENIRSLRENDQENMPDENLKVVEVEVKTVIENQEKSSSEIISQTTDCEQKSVEATGLKRIVFNIGMNQESSLPNVDI